jgi:mRNA interferase RelE/StbE
MTYMLRFRLNAEKEWRKLDAETRRQFAKKLDERLENLIENPKVPASRLHGMKDCDKIKLRTRAYRLVYQVQVEIVTVVVIAVGKRDGGDVYDAAEERQ